MNKDILQSSKNIKKAYRSVQAFYAEIPEESVVTQTPVNRTYKEKQLEEAYKKQKEKLDEIEKKLKKSEENPDDLFEEKNMTHLYKIIASFQDKLSTYNTFYTKLNDLIIKKVGNILIKTQETLLTNARDFEGGHGMKSAKKKEYLAKLDTSYNIYVSEMENYHRFRYSVNEQVLKDHENKVENFFIIYNYISSLIAVLSKLISTVQDFRYMLLQIKPYFSFVKLQNYLTKVMQATALNSKPVQYKVFLQVKHIWESQTSVIEKRTQENEPELYNDMQDFKKFINDAVSRTIPTVNEFIIDETKNVLDSKRIKFTSKIDKDFLELLNKINTKSSQFVTDELLKDIHSEIINYLNIHKISTTQNERDNIYIKIKEVIENDKIRIESSRKKITRPRSF